MSGLENIQLGDERLEGVDGKHGIYTRRGGRQGSCAGGSPGPADVERAIKGRHEAQEDRHANAGFRWGAPELEILGLEANVRERPGIATTL